MWGIIYIPHEKTANPSTKTWVCNSGPWLRLRKLVRKNCTSKNPSIPSHRPDSPRAMPSHSFKHGQLPFCLNFWTDAVYHSIVLGITGTRNRLEKQIRHIPIKHLTTSILWWTLWYTCHQHCKRPTCCNHINRHKRYRWSYDIKKLRKQVQQRHASKLVIKWDVFSFSSNCYYNMKHKLRAFSHVSISKVVKANLHWKVHVLVRTSIAY